MYKFKKHEGYAYLDDKDVLTDDVLACIFDDMEFTFGNPDKEAVGFINGYPFYATYSPESNVLTLKCIKHITEPLALNGILHKLEKRCNVDPEIKTEVAETHPCEWQVSFYFKNKED